MLKIPDAVNKHMEHRKYKLLDILHHRLEDIEMLLVDAEMAMENPFEKLDDIYRILRFIRFHVTEGKNEVIELFTTQETQMLEAGLITVKDINERT